jgi:hypothetical protein
MLDISNIFKQLQNAKLRQTTATLRQSNAAMGKPEITCEWVQWAWNPKYIAIPPKKRNVIFQYHYFSGLFFILLGATRIQVYNFWWNLHLWMVKSSLFQHHRRHKFQPHRVLGQHNGFFVQKLGQKFLPQQKCQISEDARSGFGLLIGWDSINHYPTRV